MTYSYKVVSLGLAVDLEAYNKRGITQLLQLLTYMCVPCTIAGDFCQLIMTDKDFAKLFLNQQIEHLSFTRCSVACSLQHPYIFILQQVLNSFMRLSPVTFFLMYIYLFCDIIIFFVIFFMSYHEGYKILVTCCKDFLIYNSHK